MLERIKELSSKSEKAEVQAEKLKDTVEALQSDKSELQRKLQLAEADLAVRMRAREGGWGGGGRGWLERAPAPVPVPAALSPRVCECECECEWGLLSPYPRAHRHMRTLKLVHSIKHAAREGGGAQDGGSARG